MAVEPVKNDDTVTTPPAPGSSPTPPAAPAGGESDDWFEEAKKQGFKDQKAIFTSWQEANKKISEQGEQLKKFNDFQTDVAPILDVISSDEELLGKVRTKLGGKTETPHVDKKKDGEIPNTPPVNTEVDDVMRAQLIDGFERDNGIDKLDPDTKKKVRQQIGVQMADWGTPDKIPLKRLRQIFDKSFSLAKSDPEMAKLFGNSEDETNPEGQFPSASSGGSKSDVIRLTPEQEKVAAHMPGGREQYIKGLKKQR